MTIVVNYVIIFILGRIYNITHATTLTTAYIGSTECEQVLFSSILFTLMTQTIDSTIWYKQTVQK